MRVLNAAQSTLAYLGVLAGHEHTSDAMADPLLAAFVRRMLVEESVPTLQPVPGIAPRALCRAEPRPPAQHRDPPPQPPDRHRRLAEDRAAPAQPDRERLRRGERDRAARGRDRGLDGLSHPRVEPVRQAVDGGRSVCRASRGDRRPGRRRHRGAGRRRSWPSTRSSTASSPRAPDFARPLAAAPRRPAVGRPTRSARRSGARIGHDAIVRRGGQ